MTEVVGFMPVVFTSYKHNYKLCNPTSCVEIASKLTASKWISVSTYHPGWPDLRILRPATLRNLKDPGSGREMRVDLALQGPVALPIRQSLTDDWRLKDRLGRVAKTGLSKREHDKLHREFKKADVNLQKLFDKFFFKQSLVPAGLCALNPAGRVRFFVSAK